MFCISKWLCTIEAWVYWTIKWVKSMNQRMNYIKLSEFTLSKSKSSCNLQKKKKSFIQHWNVLKLTFGLAEVHVSSK